MTTQPRQPAGARRGDETVGGRYTSKTVPAVNDSDVGFVDGSELDGWSRITAMIGRRRVTSNRSVETDNNGNEVESVTTNCDSPELMLLARKGDRGYWSGDDWRKHPDRRIWVSDIAVNMLRQGLVATTNPNDPLDNTNGIKAVVTAATSGNRNRKLAGTHRFTAIVAQIRAVRLLQSMAGQCPGWDTKLGGYRIPHDVDTLLQNRYEDISSAYKKLLRPPWDDGVEWGSQAVAGHATNSHGADMFVGEHSDLLWRALTETVDSGMSPLKKGGVAGFRSPDRYEMTAAAALYDETAAQQLTTDLFVGVHPDKRCHARDSALGIFRYALDPSHGSWMPTVDHPTECRWTEQQQDQLRGFIKIVEGLEP